MAKITKIRKIMPKKRWKLLFLLVPVLLLIIFLYFFIFRDLPSPTRLSSASLPQSTKIYDRNGTLLYTIYSDKNQSFVPLSKIPQNLQHATIAIEDKDFYKHGPVDVKGIIRAAYATLFKKQLQGGSTLTQQLVKTSLLTPERTLQRKAKELFESIATELIYSKSKILEMYLNQVPYGGTAYGVDAAAQTYFGKRAQELTLPEAALLAGLPESPTTFSPFGSHPELAKKRQLDVLSAMYSEGYITKSDYEKAKTTPLVYKKISNPILAPHFVLYIKDLLVKKYGSKTVEQGGLNVTTSLDLNLQNFAQDTVSSEIAELSNYHVGNGAALITNPGTGEILAMVGSKDYFDETSDGNVNVTLAHRQPGSSIKPINYAVGLIKGYTAATPFIDKATCYPNPGGTPYCPKNYDGKFHGVIQMRYALGNSINTSAVQMLKLNGIDAMIATASAMGITDYEKDPSRYGLSLTLGGGEVTMLEMATAYGVFANSGYRIDLHPILKVTDNHGRTLEQYSPPTSPIFGKRVLPSGVAFIISNILADNGARLLEFGPSSELKIGKNLPISVKTGTTNDFRDNWTIGYTPSFVVAAWVGNNDNTPMSNIVSGVTGAAPIWHTLMTHVLGDKPLETPVKPSNVVGMNICSTSGLLPPASDKGSCPTRFEYFIKGTQPKRSDSGLQKVFIDKTTNDLARPGQTENVEERDEVIIMDPLNNRYCVTCSHPTPTP
jgi:penicillin-binding protein 1C